MKSKIMMTLFIIPVLVSCTTTHIDPYGRDKNTSYVVEGKLKYGEDEPKVKPITDSKENTTTKLDKEEPLRVDENKEKEENLNTNKVDENKMVDNKFYNSLTEKEKKIYDKIYGIKRNEEKVVEEDKKPEEKIEEKIVDEKLTKDKINEINNLIFNAGKGPQNPVKVEESKVETKKDETSDNKGSVSKSIKNEEKKDENKVQESTVKTPSNNGSSYKDITLSEKDEKILSLIKSYYKILESMDIMELKAKELIFLIREKQDPDISTTAVLKEIHEEIKNTNTRAFVLAISRVIKNRGLK